MAARRWPGTKKASIRLAIHGPSDGRTVQTPRELLTGSNATQTDFLTPPGALSIRPDRMRKRGAAMCVAKHDQSGPAETSVEGSHSFREYGRQLRCIGLKTGPIVA
jgi:hypothetical protein